ncbi:MAG: site-specific integrase [Ignavibacteria bacterium]|nr:site-specific integrase [Ignavibacteria bacterium]
MSKRTTKTKATAIGVTIRIRKGKNADALILDVVDRGKRTREHLGIYLSGDKDRDREAMLLAEQIKAKRLRERSLRRVGIEELQLRPEEDFLAFFDELKATRGKPWRNTRYHLSEYTKGRPRFGDISENWIDGFRRHLEEQGLKPNSIATYLDVLKTAFNIAVKQKIIGVNPFTYARPIKRVRTSREYLTVDELRALFATPTDHDMVKRSFLFACLTGLRISDLRALTWKGVQGAELRITQKKQAMTFLFPSPIKHESFSRGVTTPAPMRRCSTSLLATTFTTAAFNGGLPRQALRSTSPATSPDTRSQRCWSRRERSLRRTTFARPPRHKGYADLCEAGRCTEEACD